jgi:large subunit ribosomal protein L13
MKEDKQNAKNKIKRNWHLFDASKENLGRLASRVAVILRGKDKVSFTPHLDEGDFVVVVNSDNLKVTGNKLEDKIYYHYSGYHGGIKEISLGKLMEKDSTEVIKKAVFGMLPKNKLRKEMMKRLRVFKEEEHPYGDKIK